MAKRKGIIKRIIFGIIGSIVLFVIIVIINLMILEKQSSVVSKGQPIEIFDERKCALLVIDIQEATTGEVSMDTFYKKSSDELIKNINQLAETFNNRNNLVVYVRSEITNPLINLLNDSYAKGSVGAKFDKRLKIGSGIEVVKNRNDSFINTNLDDILNSNKIGELYIVGLDAAQCINSTVQAAQNRGYKVNLIEQAILSSSTELKDSMMVNFRERGVGVVSIDCFKTKD